MGADINAISQSANYHYVRTQTGQVFHYLIDAVMSVESALTCTYYTDYMWSIEVCLATGEEHHRGIVAMA